MLNLSSNPLWSDNKCLHVIVALNVTYYFIYKLYYKEVHVGQYHYCSFCLNSCKLSQQFLETFDNAAKDLKVGDETRLGTVDCVEHKDLCTSQNANSMHCL